MTTTKHLSKMAHVETQWLTKEIASCETTAFRNWDYGNYNPDDLVSSKGLETYKEMRRDDQIKACQQTKIMARLCTTYEIKAGDKEDRQSVEMAEFITDQLKNLRGTFKAKLRDILTARDFGYSITEKIYGIIQGGKWQGKIGLVDIKTKEPFDYRFKTDEFRNLTGILQDGIDTRDGLGTPGNPFPVHKFIIYSANKEFCNSYGQSDLREAYKAWWSKNFIMKFMNIYLERFGMPVLGVKYPESLSRDKNFLDVIDDLLKNYQAKSGFRVPDSVQLELLEASRRGDAGYREAIEMYDKKISRALLFPDMVSQGGESGGSYAMTRQRFSVFVLILEEMGYEIEDVIINDQIIKPLIIMNYGDVPSETMPRFVFEPLHEDDTKLRSDIIDIMIRNNIVSPDEDWIRNFVNIPEGKKILEGKKEGKEERGREGEREEEGAVVKIKKEYKLSRKPNKYEQKVNFAMVEKITDSYAEHLHDALSQVVVKWKDHILSQAAKILRDGNNKEVNKLWLRNTGEFKNELRNWLIKIHLDTKFDELEVLKKAGIEIEIDKKPVPRHAAFAIQLDYVSTPEFDMWAPMPLQESLEFFRTKRIAKIITKAGEKKLLVLGTIKELAFYDTSAFAITGIESQHILNQAKMILFDAIKSGDNKTAFVNLNDLFSKYIDEGMISENLASPARINTIVRTNITAAQNKGKEELFNDPDIKEFVPFVEVSAILDSRTTAYCEGMDGKIFKKSDAPSFPAHHSCRTTLVPITELESEDNLPVVSGLQDEEAKLRATGKADAVRGVGFGGTKIIK